MACKNSSSKKEPYEEDAIDNGNRRDHDYWVKAGISLFYGTMRVEEFLDWKIKVDRFFDSMGVPENKQVKIMVIRLKSIVAIWWDKLVI